MLETDCIGAAIISGSSDPESTQTLINQLSKESNLEISQFKKEEKCVMESDQRFE
jgi:hypothetical protein